MACFLSPTESFVVNKLRGLIMRDWKTRLKVIWLLISDQYTKESREGSCVMYLWTKLDDVSIKIVVEQPKKFYND